MVKSSFFARGMRRSVMCLMVALTDEVLSLSAYNRDGSLFQLVPTTLFGD